jgi:hypothetical protein
MVDFSSVKAIFFDVFGTLVDWRGSIAKQAEALLGPQGLCGTAPRASAFFDKSSIEDGAVICPAYERGVRPLALMKSAMRVALSIGRAVCA